MKRHIKIITDGSCDLPKEVIERVNPGIIGINVCFGEERQQLMPFIQMYQHVP